MDFNSKLEYIKANRKVSISKFNTVKEITNLIDFHNQLIESERNKRAEDDIHEISKFLVRMNGRKMFFLNSK